MSSARTFFRHSASSASGSRSRTIQYMTTVEPFPQDSTCKRYSGMPSRCARKSLCAIRSFTWRPSAFSLYLTTSSVMVLGTASLQSLNVTHKLVLLTSHIQKLFPLGLSVVWHHGLVSYVCTVLYVYYVT